MTSQAFTDTQKRKFLEIRRRGRASYVAYYGVLRYGGFWTLLMALIAYLAIPGLYPPFVPQAVPRLIAWLIFILPFGALGGFVYGRWMWRIFERNTRHLLDEADRSSAPA